MTGSKIPELELLPTYVCIYENFAPYPVGEESDGSTSHPKFPLLPVSQGFQEAFLHRIERLKKITPPVTSTVSGSRPVSPFVTDVTADSESVPVSPEELAKQLVAQKIYNDNDDALDKDKVPAQVEMLDIGSILVPPKTENKVMTKRELDSEKNIIKTRGKKSKSPAAKKGKVLPEFATDVATTSKNIAEVKDKPSEVSKPESEQSSEEVAEEPEPIAEPRPTSATQ